MAERPTDTLCPVCSGVFQQKHRIQGGGKRSIYCSAKCRSLDWVRGNGTKRKAAVLKYDLNPENIEKKRLRSLKSKFRKYGVTEEWFRQQLERQKHTCYGCGCNIDMFSARIDHNHTTQKVRGLLCQNCNWALGHMKDCRETCYRLSAYLDYDMTKPGIYLIGSLRNPKIPELGKVLRERGFSVWDEWYSAGPEADDYFQKYHTNLGMNYLEALESEVAQHIFYFDKAHLDLCDYGVLLHPAGKSGHLELGYMAGKGKKVYILLDGEPDRYDIMPQFAVSVHNHMEELIAELSRELNGTHVSTDLTLAEFVKNETPVLRPLQQQAEEAHFYFAGLLPPS